MTNITPPSIIVHGQVIPGPFAWADPVPVWVEAHWDKGLPWTHRADGTDEDVVQPIDAPKVLFRDGRGRDDYVFNFRPNGPLTDAQKSRLCALPCVPDLDPYMGEKNHTLFSVRRGDLQHVAETLVDVLSVTAPITADIPFFDIEDAPLSEAWAVAIINGEHPTHPNRYRGDSSALVMAVVFAMVWADMSNLQIASILLNKEYRISDHVYRQDNPRRAVRRALDRARSFTNGQT